MKVRTQLVLLFTVALAMSLALGVVVWRAAGVSDAAERQQHRARSAARQMSTLMVLTQEYAREPSESVAQQWGEKHRLLLDALQEDGSGSPHAVPPSLQRAAERLALQFRRLTDAPDGRDSPLAQRRTALLVDQLITDAQSLTDDIFRWSREAGARQTAAEHRFQWIAGGALAAMFALFVGQSVLVSARVLRFLRRLERVTRAVEGGDLSVRLGGGGSDELAQLSRRFDTMAAALDARERELRREAALREQSERRIRTITDHLPALVGYVDRSETYRFANAYYEKLFGMPAEWFVGQTLAASLGPRIYEERRPYVARALQGERVQYEHHGEVNGREIHFLVDYLPDLGIDGAVEGFYVLILDITERKNAELRQARSEEKVRSILTHAPDAFISIDAESRVTEWNRQAERTFGWRREEALGRPLTELILPTDMRAGHLAGMLRFAHAGTGPVIDRRIEVSALHRDGRCIPIELSVAAVRQGDVFVANAFLHDISARKAAEARILASRKRLRDITDNVPALIGYFDADLRMEFANGPARELFRIDPARDVRSYDMREALGDEIFAQHAPHLPAVLAGERVSFQGAVRIGHSTHYQAHLVPDRDEQGRVRGFYIMTFDLSALKQAEAKLIELARSDPLTGLPNRRSFEEKLEEALARSKRDLRAMALLFLDVDHFKQINDRDGHQAGDQVLREFAGRLKSCVRTTDTVARLAGDEFTIILEGLSEERDAAQVAEKIVQSMRAPMQIDGQLLSVTSSIGVVVVSGAQPQTESAFMRLSGLDAEDLTARADEALYRAKKAGRNSYAVYA